MGLIGIILLVVFVVICVLLVGIILLQKDEGGGLGGLFGGGGAAFGSRSQTVVTKTTYVFVTLFFVTTFGLAVINRAPVVDSLTDTANQIENAQTTGGQDWLESADETSNVEGATLNSIEEAQGEN